MSNIIRIIGTRSNGEKIEFSKEDVGRIPIKELAAIEVTEEMTESEALKRYGYKNYTPKVKIEEIK